MYLYIVTHFGCNSSASDMWPPSNWVFDNYSEAHAKYLEIRPDPKDEENESEVCNEGKDGESCIQFGGGEEYYDGCRAKRPEGAVIRKVLFTESWTSWWNRIRIRIRQSFSTNN